MKTAWALAGLIVLVGVIVWASRCARWERVFRWFPVPLWCYALPLLATALGWLPTHHSAYRHTTDLILPFALALLLLGIDLPSLLSTGRSALLAAVIGAAAIVVGAPLGVWILHAHLPLDAWKGAGALAGTWTGGTMNLLALRSLLDMPDAVFAPLIVVDALMAYSWMALLVGASGFQEPMNRWLRADEIAVVSFAPTALNSDSSSHGSAQAWCALIALGLAAGARMAGAHLPTSFLMSTANGWTILLVTTATLALSLIPWLRRIGAHGSALGYPCLYLVLAATGAQADLNALGSAPAWIGVGIVVVLLHGLTMLLAGRALRIPLSVLATASQANIGGLVSAPLVGAVYHQSLAPVGLLLAMAGNALGTYAGWGAASLSKYLLGG